MKNQDLNIELISYLYGDMSEQERVAFEQKMVQNPELKEEFEELNNVRNELPELKDMEVMSPSFSTVAEKIARKSDETRWLNYFIKPVLAVAASLTLLFITGYLTDFQLTVNNGNFSIGFRGKPDVQPTKILTEAEIRDIMKDEMARNNVEILATAEKQNVELDSRVGDIEKSVKSLKAKTSKSLITKEDLEKFFTLAETKNTEAMKEFMATATTQQQQYLKALFTEYNEYIQEQRQDDLTLIRSGFIEMKQSQTQQKLQTDQVLASLLSSVSSK